ncbi:hypothetical protein ACI2KR_06915 [Pseudomonas luteola]
MSQINVSSHDIPQRQNAAHILSSAILVQDQLDFSGWSRGERVKAFEELVPGEFYISESGTFGAQNLIKVHADTHSEANVLALFMNPKTPESKRQCDDDVFTISRYAFELSDVRLFKGVREKACQCY